MRIEPARLQIGFGLNDKKGMNYFDKMIENKNFYPCVDATFQKSSKHDIDIAKNHLVTFPRIINRYVKNKKTLNLKEAIGIFSSKTADRIGLKKRGYLRKGFYADIVIFDYEDYQNYPDNLSNNLKCSTGVEYLSINGKLVIENGKVNRILPGKVLINQ